MVCNIEDIKRIIIDLNKAITLIEEFITTQNFASIFKMRLLAIIRNFNKFHNEFVLLLNAVDEGNESFKPKKIKEVPMWKTIKYLEKIKPNNIQKNILPALIKSLTKLHEYLLPQYLRDISNELIHSVRLILGEPGTGKTHGLTNCVDLHLKQRSPALIVQAKGAPCRSWTEILSDVLNLKQWHENEIFNALEALAINRDIGIANNQNYRSKNKITNTKVLICIDGLEEDIENTSEWYKRIRQSVYLSHKYPRVKFIFSARRYFYDNTEIPKRGLFDEVNLPQEGDVQIDKVATKYFSKEHYNIKLSSFSLIKEINSLFALRLFCEEYKNRTLSESDNILKAEKDLIESKINRINEEFCSTIRIGNTRNPILEAMEVISEYFYSEHKIEHDLLIEKMKTRLNYFHHISEIDLLLDFLVNNGFLIRFEIENSTEYLNTRNIIYNISYQSLIEHILIEKTIIRIKNGKLNHIPKVFEQSMIAPFYEKPRDFLNKMQKPYNERIVQGIINRVFFDTGKLIGDDNFLVKGFDRSKVIEMRMSALTLAPENLADLYKSEIDKMFFGGFTSQFTVLKKLIIPSSSMTKSFFGAEYLHNILINKKSPFERDILWSGLDKYELRNFTEEEIWNYNTKSLYRILDEFELGQLYLSEWSKHNETPLIYAWGLSTIDQNLRSNLRIQLTKWAIHNPYEFLLLLDKIFFCNDPQIQEDLSSVMLGVANRLKKKKKINALANWALNNIFSDLDTYRNVIIRQGFRAVVERAYQLGVVNEEQLEQCRPKVKEFINIIPLDLKYLKSLLEEFYPITHDLAWYVIKNAYEKFLTHPSSLPVITKMKGIDSERFFKKYSKEYKVEILNQHSWTMAAAIAYIKLLGFNRVNGSGYTDASHGNKSEIFTYEEKYTWLAVHYLQGYLSEYFPIEQWSGGYDFITDYSQIEDISNPSESFRYFNYKKAINFNKKDWIIKEMLSNELEVETDIEKSIINWVYEEPNINFEKWLLFSSSDFDLKNNKSNWVAIYNHTGLYDSKEIGYSFLDAKALLVMENDLNCLIHKLMKNDNSSLVFHNESLFASPKTDVYSNPSDIVWMSWIEEEGSTYIFNRNEKGIKQELHITLTKSTKRTTQVEEQVIIPSKKIRRILGVCDLEGNVLKNSKKRTVGFSHKIDLGFNKDNQEIVVVDKTLVEGGIKKEGFCIAWIVTIFKQSNPSSRLLPKDLNVRRSRKYLIWLTNGELQKVKFWDEEFTNMRDKNRN